MYSFNTFIQFNWIKWSLYVCCSITRCIWSFTLLHILIYLCIRLKKHRFITNLCCRADSCFIVPLLDNSSGLTQMMSYVWILFPACLWWLSIIVFVMSLVMLRWSRPVVHTCSLCALNWRVQQGNNKTGIGSTTKVCYKPIFAIVEPLCIKSDLVRS